LADTVEISAGTGTTIATDDAGVGGHVQIVKLALSADGSAAPILADAKGLEVQQATAADLNVTEASAAAIATSLAILDDWDESDRAKVNPIAGQAGVAAGAGAVSALTQRVVLATDTTVPNVSGTVAHDGADSGNPVKVGWRAIEYVAQTPIASGDRSDALCDRHGIPFFVGGHPDVITHAHTAITTAVTDSAMVTVGAGNKIVVTALTVTLDNASTVFPSVRIGFGAASVPALGNPGILAAHGGVPAGGGLNRGDGSGILGYGADGEDLRVTTVGNATGNGLQITFSYYVVPS
jgi:hypothetical protein